MSVLGRSGGHLLCAVVGVLLVACVDPLTPASRGLLQDPEVLRDVAPCPNVAQRTTGGWCQDEYNRLDSIITAIYTGTTSCATMQTAMRSWLQSGAIVRWDYSAHDTLGLSNRFVNQEWNNGSRLEWMRLDAVRGWINSDWPGTLRHEFGHAYGNTSDENEAEGYVDYCRNSSSQSPPAQPAGQQVYITSLPDSITVGLSVIAQSNCTGGTPVWSVAAGSAVSVNSSSGEVTGVNVGSATVRVDCRGTHAQRNVGVYSPLCTLDQRLIGVGNLGSTPPVLDLTESDCSGGEAPSPPAGGAGEDGQMDCYVITAHLYEWMQGFGWVEVDTYVVGYVCYLYGNMT